MSRRGLVPDEMEGNVTMGGGHNVEQGVSIVDLSRE